MTPTKLFTAVTFTPEKTSKSAPMANPSSRNPDTAQLDIILMKAPLVNRVITKKAMNQHKRCVIHINAIVPMVGTSVPVDRPGKANFMTLSLGKNTHKTKQVAHTIAIKIT